MLASESTQDFSKKWLSGSSETVLRPSMFLPHSFLTLRNSDHNSSSLYVFAPYRQRFLFLPFFVLRLRNQVAFSSHFLLHVSQQFSTFFPFFVFAFSKLGLPGLLRPATSYARQGSQMCTISRAGSTNGSTTACLEPHDSTWSDNTVVYSTVEHHSALLSASYLDHSAEEDCRCNLLVTCCRD